MELVKSSEHQEAITLHAEILAKANAVANALVDFALSLKKMRDRELYTHFGCENFEEYTEKIVGIKSRQAYTYIRAVEGFGEVKMIEHSSLGITKLSMLLDVPANERDDFIEQNNVAEMSTRVLQEKIKSLEEKIEQMTLFADTKEEIQDNSAENEELKAQIKELEQSLAEFKAIETSRADEEHSSKIKIEELEQHHKSELERLDREKQEIAENYENKLKELPKAEPHKTPEIKEKGVIKVGVLLEQILAISKEMNNALAEVDAEKQEQTKQAILMFIQKNIVERFEG